MPDIKKSPHKKLISRRLIIRQDGRESYLEDLCCDEDMKNIADDTNKRLALMRQAMPQSNWQATVENAWNKGDSIHVDVFDVEAGESLQLSL